MNAQLEKYISENLSKGIEPQIIRQELLNAGWQMAEIDQEITKFTTKRAVSSSIPKNVPSILLRSGLAFVFLYAAVFVSGTSLGDKYVPSFVTQIMPIRTFLIIFGIFEVILSLWILSGKLKMYSGILVAVLLTVITLFNVSLFSILFRNIAIIAAALAFAFL